MPHIAHPGRFAAYLAAGGSGGSNAAIGDTLGMTKRAVEKHINSIFAKLAMPPTADVSRRVRAVLIYLAETSAATSEPDRPPRETAARP